MNEVLAVDTGSDAVNDDDSKRSLTVEAEAAKMGWTPKEKFKGDPEKWVDADTFFERGQHVLPIVKQQLKEVKAELAEVRKVSSEYQKFADEAAERRWKDKYDELRVAKQAAIEASDGKSVVAIDDAIDTHRENKPAKTEEPKVDPAFASWKSDNDWYGKDEDLTDAANVIGLRLSRKGVLGRDLYDKVREKLATQFPDHEVFAVERPGPQRGGKPSGLKTKAKSYENLPADAKKACDRFLKSGMIKSKEQYVDAYDWEQ